MRNIGLLMLFLVFVSGCKTTDPGSKFVGSSVIAVDAAMKTWADYVVLSNPSIEEQEAVKRAHDKYRLAMTASLNAIALYKNETFDKKDLNQVMLYASQVSAELLMLIMTLSQK